MRPPDDYEMTRAVPVLHLANQVADNIKEEFPHVMVDTLAYRGGRMPLRFAHCRNASQSKTLSRGELVLGFLERCDFNQPYPTVNLSEHVGRFDI